MSDISYVNDWSSVTRRRYREAQKAEMAYWRQQDPKLLNLHAKYYFYAGYYEWTKHRGLLYPFCVSPSSSHNFQIPSDIMEGRFLLDVGCGPMPFTLSLVHCAEVHVLDPLIEFYKDIQPFGWEYFNSISSARAEQLPYEDKYFDFVYCSNVLDHTQNADNILREIVRVLRPSGQLLFDCDVREGSGGGLPHPYKWSVDTLEARIFQYFEQVTVITLIDENNNNKPVTREQCQDCKKVKWVCNLRVKSNVS